MDYLVGGDVPDIVDTLCMSVYNIKLMFFLILLFLKTNNANQLIKRSFKLRFATTSSILKIKVQSLRESNRQNKKTFLRRGRTLMNMYNK